MGNKLCGYIFARVAKFDSAYMLPIEPVFEHISRAFSKDNNLGANLTVDVPDAATIERLREEVLNQKPAKSGDDVDRSSAPQPSIPLIATEPPSGDTAVTPPPPVHTAPARPEEDESGATRSTYVRANSMPLMPPVSPALPASLTLGMPDLPSPAPVSFPGSTHPEPRDYTAEPRDYTTEPESRDLENYATDSRLSVTRLGRSWDKFRHVWLLNLLSVLRLSIALCVLAAFGWSIWYMTEGTHLPVYGKVLTIIASSLGAAILNYMLLYKQRWFKRLCWKLSRRDEYGRPRPPEMQSLPRRHLFSRQPARNRIRPGWGDTEDPSDIDIDFGRVARAILSD